MRSTPPHVAAVFALLFWILLLPPCLSWSDDAKDEEAASSGKVELKREATDRGTHQETTKTTLKASAFLQGTVSLLRVEIPFPDDKTSFEGDLFNPRLGDIKVRAGFRPLALGSLPLSSFLEATFPTAEPERLGSGKYQSSAGLETVVPLPLPQALAASHRLVLKPLVQQVISVAGDDARKTINYSKMELTLRDTWRKTFWGAVRFKPVLNWQDDGKTGAVAEIEFGWRFHSHWETWLMGGTCLWGHGVPTTYQNRVGLGVSYRF